MCYSKGTNYFFKVYFQIYVKYYLKLLNYTII